MNLCNYLYNASNIWIQKGNRIFLNTRLSNSNIRSIDVGIPLPHASAIFFSDIKGYRPTRFSLEMPELSSILPPSQQSWTYVMNTIEVLRCFPTDMTRPLKIIFPTKW